MSIIFKHYLDERHKVTTVVYKPLQLQHESFPCLLKVRLKFENILLINNHYKVLPKDLKEDLGYI